MHLIFLTFFFLKHKANKISAGLAERPWRMQPSHWDVLTASSAAPASHWGELLFAQLWGFHTKLLGESPPFPNSPAMRSLQEQWELLASAWLRGQKASGCYTHCHHKFRLYNG